MYIDTMNITGIEINPRQSYRCGIINSLPILFSPSERTIQSNDRRDQKLFSTYMYTFNGLFESRTIEGEWSRIIFVNREERVPFNNIDRWRDTRHAAPFIKR